ncbi:hypothetical protein ACQP2X_26350 [Actinoplanes sp. CA-131856]
MAPVGDSADDPGTSLLTLTVVGPDSQEFLVEGVPGDEPVRNFLIGFLESGYPEVPWRLRQWKADLIAGPGPVRLDPQATLLEAGVRDGSRLAVSAYSAAGGFGLPELLTFVGGMLLSGAVGNAGYDLLKVTCKSIAERWSARRPFSGRQRLSAGEATELARSAACLRFDIGDPSRLRLEAANPLILRYDHTGIQSLRTRRFASRRALSESWSCVFTLAEAGLPASMTILVRANPPDPERTFVYLLPDRG